MSAALRPAGLRRNAVMAVAQVVVTGGVLLFVYRFLLATIGSADVGIWATVLSTSSVARISELGFSNSATKFVAASGNTEQAAEVVETTILTIAGFLAALAGLAYVPFAHVLAHNIPAASLGKALTILPYAMVSVWMSGLAGATQSALDGCQRADRRAVLGMATSIAYLVFVRLLTPRFGLVGLGAAQVLQVLLLLVAGWIALRRQLPVLPVVPFRWSRTCFRRMVRYGASFQLISVAALLSDPVAKLAVSRFGSLTAVAYFTLAQRIVLQARTLIVAANQVLVPRLAALHEAGQRERTSTLYYQSYRIVFLLAVPMSLLVVASLPLVSRITIGRIDTTFIVFGVLLVGGYFVNTLSTPAYVYGLGIGAMRWNVVSHVLLAVLNLALSYGLGTMFGATGAVAGASAALATASFATIIGTSIEQRFPLKGLVPVDGALLAAAWGRLTARLTGARL